MTLGYVYLRFFALQGLPWALLYLDGCQVLLFLTPRRLTGLTAEQNYLSRSELLAGFHGDDVQAETLSGRIFNSIQNALSPSVGLSEQELKARGKKNDQLATVVADSLAMMPVIRGMGAGFIRATALAKVHGGFADFAENFGKDFAEGAVLNKVVLTCAPEGRLGRALNERFAKSMLGETAAYAVMGAGVGTVTTGFRSETWKDKEGNFVPGQGALDLVKAGTIGGVLSVPAALLTSKVSRLGLRLGAEGQVSQTTALAISGLGSGYLSGAMLGGVHSAMSGESVLNVMKSMNESGLTGALTGAIGLSALGRNTRLDWRASLPAEHASPETLTRVSAMERFAKTSDSSNVEWKSRAGEKRLAFEELGIARAKLDDSDATLAARVAKLGTPWQGHKTYLVAAPQSLEAASRSNNFAEFCKFGGVESRGDRLRIYGVKEVAITIPETYAQKLDEVLQLRLLAAQKPDLYIEGPHQVLKVELAREALSVHPLKDRAHPADFVQLLDELPDRRLIKELFIREDQSPDNAWRSKEDGRPVIASATAEKNGIVTTYAAQRNDFLRPVIKHEWGHLLKWKWETDSELFDQFAILEKDGFYTSEYSKKNNDENWAEHVATLLDPDADKFYATASGAPLRTFAIGRALVRTMNTTPSAFLGTHQAELRARVNFLDANVKPEAQTALASLAGSAHRETAIAAIKLMPGLGRPQDFDVLHDAAKNNPDMKVRTAAAAAVRRYWATLGMSSGFDRTIRMPRN